MHTSKDSMWWRIWKILQNFLGTKQGLSPWWGAQQEGDTRRDARHAVRQRGRAEGRAAQHVAVRRAAAWESRGPREIESSRREGGERRGKKLWVRALCAGLPPGEKGLFIFFATGEKGPPWQPLDGKFTVEIGSYGTWCHGEAKALNLCPIEMFWDNRIVTPWWQAGPYIGQHKWGDITRPKKNKGPKFYSSAYYTYIISLIQIR
jgi:hypothetical protein